MIVLGFIVVILGCIMIAKGSSNRDS